MKAPTGNMLQRRLLMLAGCAVIGLLPAVADAQVASALLREDDELLPGETISALGNTAVNHVGGYACGLTTVGTATISRIWGNAAGGTGMLMRSEGTFGVFEQTSFESFYGMSDTGQLAYSAIAVNTDTGDTGLDGAWLDDLPILVELDPVPSLPGQFSTFNSRAGVTGDGIIHWVGGFTDTQGGSTQNRALFRGAGATSLLMGGDLLPGIAEPVDTAGGIDFDWRVSRFGTNWIDQVLVDTSSTNDGVIVINGVPLMAGGSITRENEPVPAAIGGLPGELWDNFDFLGINEAGAYLVTGDTNADTSLDEFIMLDGMIILREGDMLDLDGTPVTLRGSIEGGYRNENLDWAVIWDIDDDTGTNLEALIFNGEILLVEGDPVDWNGDGVIDAADNGGIVDNFTGISALTVGPPVGGIVNVYFTADISFAGDVLEGFFCLPVQVGQPAIPVTMIFKQGACPAPVNRNSNGIVKAVLTGEMGFDVLDIDLDSLELRRCDGLGGAALPNMGNGPQIHVKDKNHPNPDPATCETGGCTCNEENFADGILDLEIPFRTPDLVEALELDGEPEGAVLTLVLTGTLDDGTPFAAADCIRLVPPGTPPGYLAVVGNPGSNYIEIVPLDNQLDGGGYGEFVRDWPIGTFITLTAPAFHEGRPLVGWRWNGLPLRKYGEAGTPTDSLSVTIILMYEVQDVEPIYGPPTGPGTGTGR